MAIARKMLIIHNPTAGRKRTKRYLQILNRLKISGMEPEIIKTEYAGHAHAIARTHKNGPYDIICAAGGDGTINEVLNGLYPCALPFGLIPLGTANVLAKELFTDEAPENIADILLEGQKQDCWLGKVKGQYFSLMVSMGPDADTVVDVNLTLKKYIGKAAYALSFIKQILFFRAVTYNVVVDGISHQACAVIISKGKHYGGKFICTPDADLAHRDFHIALFTKKGRWAALGYALKMVRNKIPQDKSVKIISGKEISVCADRPAYFQVDGDPGGRLPVTITLSDTPVPMLCAKS